MIPRSQRLQMHTQSSFLVKGLQNLLLCIEPRHTPLSTTLLSGHARLAYIALMCMQEHFNSPVALVQPELFKRSLHGYSARMAMSASSAAPQQQHTVGALAELPDDGSSAAIVITDRNTWASTQAINSAAGAVLHAPQKRRSLCF